LRPVMNRENVIPLIISAVAIIAAVIIVAQCGGGIRNPAVSTIVRTDTISMPADTILLPGSVTVQLKPVKDTAVYRILRDSLADLRLLLDSVLFEASHISTITARADTIVKRTALISRDTSVFAVPFHDTLHLEYRYPPVDRFVIARGAVRIVSPTDTVQTVRYESRPWWIDLAIGIVGAAISWLAADSR